MLGGVAPKPTLGGVAPKPTLGGVALPKRSSNSLAAVRALTSELMLSGAVALGFNATGRLGCIAGGTSRLIKSTRASDVAALGGDAAAAAAAAGGMAGEVGESPSDFLGSSVF